MGGEGEQIIFGCVSVCTEYWTIKMLLAQQVRVESDLEVGI